MDNNRRILIVDDNPSIHQDIRSILLPKEGPSLDKLQKLEEELFGKDATSSKETTRKEHEKYEISSAYQGDEALKLIKEATEQGNPFSLVFMDVRMPPGIDGIETIQRIQKDFPNTEIIICTAYSDYSWEEIIEKLGRDHNILFLKKPFESTSVQQMALSLTKKWNALRETKDLIDNLEQKVAEKTKDLQKSLVQIKQEMEERERVQSELEEQRAKTLYAAKMASLGEIAGGIAHEINNPLTVILTSGEIIQEILEDTPDDVDSIKLYVGKIIAMSERAGKIVKGLKNISRKADNDPFLDTPLSEIINETVDLVEQKFKEFDIELTVTKVSDSLIIPCRKTEISQVFLNLLNNSFDAIVKDENKWISCEVIENDKDVLVQFTDSGNGIPKEIAEKILQPFFTTKEVGKGTGLGLSISKGLIEAHNGTLEIDDSCPNTRFKVILPKNQESKS